MNNFEKIKAMDIDETTSYEFEDLKQRMIEIYKIVSYKLALQYDITGKLQEIKNIIER